MAETTERPAAQSAELAKLLQRAHRVRDEAQRLSEDYHFLAGWRRMRPRHSIRPAEMLRDIGQR
jgi:hypothetical protein